MTHESCMFITCLVISVRLRHLDKIIQDFIHTNAIKCHFLHACKNASVDIIYKSYMPVSVMVKNKSQGQISTCLL